MSGRKSKEYLNKLKEKYKVDILWSWSRYNSYKTDPYGYLLKYILHVPETKTSIYSVSGGVVHDILEKFYKKEIAYDDMLKEYEDRLFEMNMAELKYDRANEDKNKSISDKYENNIRLFFQNYIPIDGKTITEQFITVRVGIYVFQGYIDFIHRCEDGFYIIEDFKTSTIYVGEKIAKERGQLVLYAESLIQRGIPLDKIKVGWNFLKYCTVESQLQGKDKETGLHKTKTKNALRTEWVKEISSNIKTWLKKMEYDDLEIADIIQTCCENNNLDILPKDLQERYKVSDCYVYIPLTQEIIDDLKENINKTLDEITEKEKEYQITKDDRLFWTEITKKNEYFFYNLCGYSTAQHKPFKEYLDDSNVFTKETTKSNDEDMSWLDDL